MGEEIVKIQELMNRIKLPEDAQKHVFDHLLKYSFLFLPQTVFCPVKIPIDEHSPDRSR